MPHVLYNHITHSWDEPDAEDSWRESPAADEPMEFTPQTRRAVARLALAAGTLLTALVLWGLIAGIVLGTA